MIDCTYKWHDGCDHGWAGDGLTYLTTKNSCEEKDYPYVGTKQECTYSSETCKHKIVNSYWQIQTIMNSNAFKNGVSLKPSAAVLDAECKAFRFYSEGVIKYDDCYPFDYPNFSVTAVGYGKD